MDKKRRNKSIILTSLILTIIFVFSIFSAGNVSGVTAADYEHLAENCVDRPEGGLYCLGGDVYGIRYTCSTNTNDCALRGADVLHLVKNCNKEGLGPCYQAVGGIAHCLNCANTDTSCGYGDTCSNCASMDATGLYCSPLDGDLRGNYYHCDSGSCKPLQTNHEVKSCGGHCTTVGGVAHCMDCANTDTSCANEATGVCTNCEDRSAYPRINFICGVDGDVYGLGWRCGGSGCVRDTFVEWDHDCLYGCTSGVCRACISSGTICGIGNPCTNCCAGAGQTVSCGLFCRKCK